MLCPGLGDHAHAYQPAKGSGCLPTFGSNCKPNTQSSNKAGINFILCLLQMAKKVSSVFKKYSGSSSYTANCNTARKQFKPIPSASANSLSIATGSKLVLS